MEKLKLLGLVFSVLAFSSSLSAAESFLSSSDGISFYQLDFPDNVPPVLDSTIGLLEINLLSLRASTGMNSGYINAVVGGSWVIRNMPILIENDYPYPLLSTRFDLGVSNGNTVSQLSVDILYSDDVKTAGVTGGAAAFPVADLDFSQGGAAPESEEELDAGGPADPAPPTLNDVLFGDPENTTAIMQLDHPNVEAALNQCVPMSVANSLQYLEDTTDLVIPHTHKPGLKGDDSLVGQLGAAMGRDAESRTKGGGVKTNPAIQGKMRYLAENNLQDRIKTTTWGLWGASKDQSVTVDGRTANSTSKGSTVVFTDVVSALQGGQDCEANYYFEGGAHAIDIVGAGITNGQPWMIEGSDIDQKSDSKGAGPKGFIFSHLIDSDKDGSLNMNGSSTELHVVICQEYIPVKKHPDSFLPPPDAELFVPGIGLEIIDIIDPAGHQSFVDNPPSVLDVNLGNNLFTLQGSPSWMPLALTPDGSGGLSGSNTATVAGNSNITNTISMTFQETTIDATITLGANGGLPQGQPIIFNTRLSSTEAWPWIQSDAVPPALSTAIRTNGFRHSFASPATDPLSVGLSLEPGNQAGTNADWWIVAQSGDITAYYDLATANWIVGPLQPSRQAPLAEIASETVFRAPGSALPPGQYTFYFGVDTVMNGELDLDSLTFDSVVLTLQ